jgi:hypothetical protein
MSGGSPGSGSVSSGPATTGPAGVSASGGSSVSGATGVVGGSGASVSATSSVASIGVGPASGIGGVGVGAAISAEEDALLRLYLGGVQFNESTAATSLTTTQTASLLYRSGNKRAAKELLCDHREVYAAFKRTASPCLTRADSELRRIDQASVASAQPVFRRDSFGTQAECLTAAYNSGVALSACSGK